MPIWIGLTYNLIELMSIILYTAGVSLLFLNFLRLIMLAITVKEFLFNVSV